MDTSLVIKVDQITEPRKAFVRLLSAAFLKQTFADAPEWSAADEAELDARLTKVDARNVILEGTTQVSLTSACRRCLQDVSTKKFVSFTLNLVNRSTPTKGLRARRDAEDDGEGDLSSSFEDDPDEAAFDGEKIDLAPLVREQILLSLPAAEPLCTQACLGLCASCGHNLNEGECGHAQQTPDPRWNALKNVKLKH